MIMAPIIECKTSLLGASEQGKSRPQKTDNPNMGPSEAPRYQV